MFSSYLIYFSAILASILLAGAAQKYSTRNKKGISIPHRLFWFLSLIILIFIMGFRANSVGVDDLNYLRNYNIANSMNFFQYYSTYVTEPGFYFLYKFVYVFFGDFQWLIIITSAITLTLFYKALSFEIENISLPLAIFIFALTQYFYYFGIIRMGLSVAIIAFGFRYILRNEKKKYFLLVLLATLFHYSSLFGLILLFLNFNKSEKFKKSNLLKIILLIPVSFIFVRVFVFPFIGASRYQGYIESDIGIDFGFLSSLPFLVLFFYYYNKIPVSSKNYKHFQFYFFLFLIKVVTEIFAPIIGIGRMVWYVNLSLCVLLPFTIKITKDFGVKMFLIAFTFFYCFIYSSYAYFANSHRGMFLLPYKNIVSDFFVSFGGL